jgi:hypothetical protein
MWTVDQSVRKVIRQPNKLGRGGGAEMIKRCCEQHMLLYKKQHSPASKKFSKEEWAKKYTIHLDQVTPWYGDPKEYNNSGRSGAANGGYPYGSDVYMNYQPPYKDARLMDADGKPLRPGAEKSVAYMQMLLMMYTKDGSGEWRSWVYDPYGGSMAMGVACLALNRRYRACEIHIGVFASAVDRMQKFVIGRLRGATNKSTEPIPLNTGSWTAEGAQVVTTLACRALHNIALTMFPPTFGPEITKNETIANHLDQLEIKTVPKTEMLAKGKKPMGKGLYTTTALQSNVSLEVPLYAYGTLCQDKGRTSKSIGNGHQIRLRAACFDGLVMNPAANCLMRFMNNCQGTGRKANMALIETDISDLKVDEGYKLLECVPCVDIEPGTQLLLNYQQTFFSANHRDDVGTEQVGDTDEKKKSRRVARNATAVKTGRLIEVDSSEEEEEESEQAADEGEESASDGASSASDSDPASSSNSSSDDDNDSTAGLGGELSEGEQDKVASIISAARGKRKLKEVVSGRRGSQGDGKRDELEEDLTEDRSKKKAKTKHTKETKPKAKANGKRGKPAPPTKEAKKKAGKAEKAKNDEKAKKEKKKAMERAKKKRQKAAARLQKPKEAEETKSARESEEAQEGAPSEEQSVEDPPFPNAFGKATTKTTMVVMAASGCCFCGTVRSCSPSISPLWLCCVV